jgi:phenylacetic acid degradation operon negative regulatory protein
LLASLGDLGDPRHVARDAWDLSAVEARYEAFIDQVRGLRPRSTRATLAAQIRLVQEWRRFPFIDPRLPPELLPDRWSGTRAAALFRARHAAWKPRADVAWDELVSGERAAEDSRLDAVPGQHRVDLALPLPRG